MSPCSKRNVNTGGDEARHPIGSSYPLGIVIADEYIRTGPGHPPAVIEVFQGGDATFEAEERIPQRRGVAKSSE